MYYVCDCDKEHNFGVLDTKDNTLEYIPSRTLGQLMLKGVEVHGVNVDNSGTVHTKNMAIGVYRNMYENIILKKNHIIWCTVRVYNFDNASANRMMEFFNARLAHYKRKLTNLNYDIDGGSRIAEATFNLDIGLDFDTAVQNIKKATKDLEIDMCKHLGASEIYYDDYNFEWCFRG